MEKKQTATAWIWAVGMLVIVAIVLGLSTLGSADEQADTTLQQYEGMLVQLFPKASQWEQVEKTENTFVYRAVQGGNELGYAVMQTVQGYAGPVEVITGIDAGGIIAGIHVGGAPFRETEGLGGKARDASFTNQFKGKKPPLTLGGDIDAISGATITSRAVVDAVNQAQSRIPGFAAPTAQPEPNDAAGMTANASVMGYGGPVLVRLTLDDQGKIAALDVGGARFAETEGVGSRVREDTFIQPFIGLTPPVKLGEDIDAISGATISSQAVADAVNEAAAFLTQKEEPSDTN